MPSFKNSALRITGIYLVTGSLWILLSDKILGMFINDAMRMTEMQTYKGWFFIGLTSLLLYGLIRRDQQRRESMLQALHESRQRFRTIAETTPISLLIASLKDGTVLWSNSFADKTLGLFEGGLGGHSLAEVRAADEGQPNLLEVLQGQAVIIQSEMRLLDEQGRPVWVVLSARRNHYEGQEAIFCSLADITTSKHQEEENLQLQIKVQHTQKLESLGLMASGIAHDFNNLLTSMMGNADLASMELPPDSMAARAIERTKAAAAAAAELTQQLLAYAGKGRGQVEPVDFNALVEDMANMLRISISGKVDLAIELAPDSMRIEGDPSQLRQVILNLITNASDAIGDQSGRIRIRTGTIYADRAMLLLTTLGQKLPEGDYLYFEVTDTGCGMQPDQVERIFDPFFTTKIKGRGLGLAAVLGITRSHHGAIKVYSEPGRGTTFRVYFPLLAGKEAQAENRHGDEIMKWRGDGTLLIADDDPSVLNVARKMVERFGFSVLTARNGREAVEIFERDRDTIRAVLLDLVMPEMDGFEALKAIRKLQPGIPVIISSGFTEDHGLTRLTGRDLSMFIKKPYTVRNLMAKVREAVGG